MFIEKATMKRRLHRSFFYIRKAVKTMRVYFINLSFIYENRDSQIKLDCPDFLIICSFFFSLLI